MEPEQFFLKWNNFENNLTSGFTDLLQKEAMVDVTLAAGGKIIHAHKIILSICSSYFKNMFQVNPCQHPIIILKDVGFQELSDMLDFMYKGEANVRQQDLPSFLKLAETLKIKGLAGSSSEPDECVSSKNSTLEVSDLDQNTLFDEKESKNCETVEEINGRTKRRRPSSPYKSLDSSISGYTKTIKTELQDFEHNFREETTCSNVKERLSDNSLDSFDYNNHLLGMEKSPGPLTFDDNIETHSQDFWNQRRTSKPLSIIWSFFNFDCLENKSECKLCGKIFKASPKTGTASVKYHLHFAHQILRNESGTQ